MFAREIFQLKRAKYETCKGGEFQRHNVPDLISAHNTAIHGAVLFTIEKTKRQTQAAALLRRATKTNECRAASVSSRQIRLRQTCRNQIPRPTSPVRSRELLPTSR